jgi:hypothetical protein
VEDATPHYNAEITAGSLLLKESRAIVQLLLQGADEKAWYQAIAVDNVLQKTSPASARRMATLIRKRLETMPRELWVMIAEGTTEVATQSLLAAAIKHSQLLGDFMLQVLRSHYRAFDNRLSMRDWDSFVAECAHVDPVVATWSKTTINKIRQVVFRILSEAGYLHSTRSMRLQSVFIAPDVSKFLFIHDETYVLKCMEISHE